MGFNSVLGLVVSVVVASLYIILYCDLEWNKFSLRDIGESQLIGKDALFAYRVCCSIIVWSLSTYLFVDKVGLEITLKDRAGQNKLIKLVGPHRFTMFTLWCWTLEGVYFLCATLWSYIAAPTFALPMYYQQLLARITWVLFEVSITVVFPFIQVCSHF
jgi:hypothetical protein